MQTQRNRRIHREGDSETNTEIHRHTDTHTYTHTPDVGCCLSYQCGMTLLPWLTCRWRQQHQEKCKQKVMDPHDWSLVRCRDAKGLELSALYSARCCLLGRILHWLESKKLQLWNTEHLISLVKVTLESTLSLLCKCEDPQRSSSCTADHEQIPALLLRWAGPMLSWDRLTRYN